MLIDARCSAARMTGDNDCSHLDCGVCPHSPTSHCHHVSASLLAVTLTATKTTCMHWHVPGSSFCPSHSRVNNVQGGGHSLCPSLRGADNIRGDECPLSTCTMDAGQMMQQPVPAAAAAPRGDLDFEKWYVSGLPLPLIAACAACQKGVKRAHLVDARHDGGLLLELYSRDGVGTMLSADFYEVCPALALLHLTPPPDHKRF